MSPTPPKKSKLQDWEIDPDQVTFIIAPEFRIGSGGYGDVYEGTYCGIKVAVKVLKLRNGEGMDKAFMREVRGWHNLKFEHILPMYGACTAPVPMMVSPLMQNGNMLDYLQKNKDANRIQLLCDVARGMYYLEIRGIVHADLNPLNAFVDEHGKALVGDFGLAKFEVDMPLNVENTGGTVWFMAPERMMDQEPGTTPRPVNTTVSDIYSFGILVFSAWTRDGRPYGCLSSEIEREALLEDIVNSQRRPDLNDARLFDMPKELMDLMQRCWVADPSARPKSFLDILNALEVLLRAQQAVAPPGLVARSATSTASGTFVVPFPRNDRFTGREEPLAKLEQELLGDGKWRKGALIGLGGVGKTQVALELAYRVKDRHPNYSVIWLPAMTVASFTQACEQAAESFGLEIAEGDQREDPKEVLKRHLETSDGRYFLIVDNADDIEVVAGSGSENGIKHYLPQSERGRILFTTRSNRAATVVAQNKVVKLDLMDVTYALDFLRASLREDRQNLLDNLALSTELLHELTCLPLAIAQAAAYFNSNLHISAEQYLDLLRDREWDRFELLSEDFEDETRYVGSPNSVGTTWMLSFEQIQRDDPAAAEILSFAACVDAKAIPRSLLPPVASSKVVMDKVIGTLVGYAFFAPRSDGQLYDMHRLVHASARKWLQQQGTLSSKTESALKHLATVFHSDDWFTRPVWSSYLPHVKSILEGDEGMDLEDRYTLCYWLGRCMRVEGQSKEAVTWLEKCELGRSTILPPEHHDLLYVRAWLANAYRIDGKLGKAVTLMEQVVAVTTRILDPEHPSRLESQRELAAAYQDNGQVEKAVELLGTVVAIRTRILPEEQPDRLASQHELARAYLANGQVAKAVELLETVVAIRTRTVPEDDLDLLASQRALGNAYQASGMVEKAVRLLEHVVEITAHSTAEEHPEQLKSQQSLAIAYKANGHLEKAVPLLNRAVSIAGRTMSVDHPSRVLWERQLRDMREVLDQVGETTTSRPRDFDIGAVAVAAETAQYSALTLQLPSDASQSVDGADGGDDMEMSTFRFVWELFAMLLW